jgi:thymidine phosphorylase
MVAAQGGDLESVCSLAPERIVESSQSGFVASIDMEVLGHVIVELGGGRKQPHHAVDHSVGLDVLVRVGDERITGEPLVRVFGHKVSADVCREIQNAFQFSDSEVTPLPLIVDRVPHVS